MAEEEPQNKRRRTQHASHNEASGAARDVLALYRSLDVQAMPFSWVQRIFDPHILATTTSGERASCRQAIQSLAGQLLQVKHRLKPVANECAETVNDHLQASDRQWRSAPGHGRYSAQDPFTPSDAFHEARSFCNPFEILGQHNGLNRRFINRSAIKLVNVDALLDFRLVQPVAPNETYVFVDLCGAPGGFSEYIMHRCRENKTTRSCHGYGMSLLAPNEHGHGFGWKLHDHESTKHGTTCRYTICKGQDGTGDVYKWENVVSLQEQMRRDGHVGGAHLVVADGGIDAQRDIDDQEGLTQKLLVCEVTAALACLRPGGTLVLKMFGCQTSTIKCMMTEIQKVFRHIHMFKPVSSRPASAESYMVATGFRGLPPSWNAQEWRDSVFLAWRFDRDAPANQEFCSFLDTFDHDMFHLNLTACFSILSYMETKKQGLKINRPLLPYGDQYEVPLERYRRAWRLG